MYTHLKDKRVLILDDEKIILDILTKLFNHYSIHVDTAMNADEAVDKYNDAFSSGSPHDIVIIDLLIEGKPLGLKVLEQLKEIDVDCKTLVMSGSTNHPAVKDYNQYGFDNCIFKPFNFEKILEIVKETIT